MAAPPSKTIADLNGKWSLNKTLSDNPEPALALQGIGFFVRKAIGLASVTLSITQYSAPPSPPADPADPPATRIEIEQTATAGLKGTTENRCVDWRFREQSDWLFGHVKGQTKWTAPADIEDAFLAKGWIEGEAENTGPQGESHLFSHVVSLDNGWVATQIWGFQMVNDERRYARNIVIAKDGKRVEIRLVYDFLV